MRNLIWKKKYKRMLIDENVYEWDVDTYVSKHMPHSLFRYMSFDDYWKRNLFEGQIFFSSAEVLNDPFDCLAYVREKDWHIEKINERIKDVDPELSDSLLKECASEVEERVLKNIQCDLKKEARVACFSETVDSILMWSHYANKHKGFCIEYDFSVDKTLNKIMYPVIYGKNRFDATNIFISPNEHSALSPFYFKSKEWGYEKEWRLVAHEKMFSDNEFYYNAPNCIRGIYFGINADEDCCDEIKKWAKDNKNIKLYQMSLHKKKYAIFPKVIE